MAGRGRAVPVSGVLMRVAVTVTGQYRRLLMSGGRPQVCRSRIEVPLGRAAVRLTGPLA